MSEVEFPPRQYPPVLAKLCAGFVFTADSEHGIRVWAAKDPAICLATVSFKSHADSSKICPTALAVSGMQEGQDQDVVVGFEDGHYDRYIFHSEVSRLELQSSHTGSSQGAVTAMALSSPFLLMVSHDKRLSLHRLYPEPAHPESGKESSGPSDADSHSRELTSLKADNMIAPMTLCLRKSPFEIVATIVYSFFHIGCGWALGIQELHFNKEGEQLESRLTSTVDSQYGIEQSRLSQSRRRRSTTTATATARTESTSHHHHHHHHNLPDDNPPTMPSILHKQPPTSMSYSHPYLLTSHADNTLTMYLVVSNSTNLFVRGGQRLWGHTSSVSTVQVTNRGKAISVGTRGDEIRIWELETAISSLGSTRCFNEDSSIQVSPEKGDREEKGKVYISDGAGEDRKMSGDAGGSGGGGGEESRITIHECVGFDEERVLLLREKGIGTQLLECYDFT